MIPRFCVALLVATFYTNVSADAYSFSPLNTLSHLKGRVTIATNGKSVKCRGKLAVKTQESGTTRKASARINAIKLSSTGTCGEFVWDGLPFEILATGPSSGELFNFGFANPTLGACTANPIPFSVNKSGNWVFQGTETDCTFTGSMLSVPPIVIVK